MDNKNNLNKNIKPGSKPMSLAEKLLAADQAKEDARNMYQQENAFKEQRAASEKERLESYRNQGYVEAPKSSDTPISTRNTSARQMEQAKTKDGNSNASNLTRQNFGRTVIQRNEHHRSGTTQANVGANNNKPTNNTIQNNTIQNNTNTKSNPQVSTPSRLHTASRTNVPPVSNESSKGGNFNARNEFTNRNLGESNQGARIPSPTYNAKNQANVNQTSSYTFNYNRGAFKGNKNFGGNENTVGGESGASYTPPVNRSTNIQPNHIESGSRSGSKENKGTRNGNAISRGNVASASAITGTSLYSNAVRVSNMSQSEKLQGADKARSDAQQMYQEEDRRRRMREAVEKSNLEKFEERLENHRSKNKISVDLNDVLPPRENRKVVSHYKSVRVEERPLAASKNDRMAPKTKAQHKEKEGAKTRQDVNAQASNKQANNNNKTVGNQGTKTGKIENTRQNTTIKTYKRTSYRMNQEEIKNIKDQIRGASKKSSKLTVKQALGKTMGTTKSIGKAGKTVITDAASAMNSDYAAAEFTKKQANRVGTKIAKSAGVGGVLSFAKGGVELLTSDDSAKTMTEVSTKIATKAIDKVIHVDRNLKKRAENEIKKQTKTVGKLDKKYDKLNSKELKLREKADKKYKKAKSKKNPKYKEKADKLTMKADKLRDKHAKANRKLGLKRNKETVRLNNLKAKARKKIARSKAAKKMMLKLVAGASLPLLLIVLITVVVGGGVSVGGYLITKFASDAVNFASLSWTKTGQKLETLENMNWAQYIADDTINSLGDTFVETAKEDARIHFIDKKIKLGDALKAIGDSSYPTYEWYCDIGEGSIGRTWMREECDNITDKDGKMIFDADGNMAKEYVQLIQNNQNNYKNTALNNNLLYKDGGKIDDMAANYGYEMKYTYKNNKNERQNIGIHDNIVPIISMAHDRYTDVWTWENYEVVEAYVWYMYTLSHNAAHYDAGYDYNKSDAGTYSYTMQTPCKQDIFTTSDYLNKFSYENGVLKRPTTEHGLSCTNIYFHGYELSEVFDSTLTNQVKSKAKETGKTVLSWIDGITGTKLAEKINIVGTNTISYVRDEKGNVIKGKFVVNGKEYETLYEVKKLFGYDYIKKKNQETGEEKFVEYVCDNVQYKKASETKTCGISKEHTHKEGNCNTTKCGNKQQHKHSDACDNLCSIGRHEHSDSCKTNCNKPIHIHVDSCCKHNLDEHTHSDGCKKEVRTCGHYCGEECYGGARCQHSCNLKNCKPKDKVALVCGFPESYNHQHTNDCCKLKLEEHTKHTDDCCPIKEHTKHTDDCCKIKEHTHGASCCDIQTHTHKEWDGVRNPGCYDTFAFCAGHCGGHIKPSVNIAVTYTMEGLAYQDAVALNAGTSSGKDSSWTGVGEFQNLCKELQSVTSLKEWATKTNTTCQKWFKAGPNGPASAIRYLGDVFEKERLKIFRGWRNFWQGLNVFGSGDDSTAKNDIANGEATPSFTSDETGEDAYEFNGWFEGEGKEMSFNKYLFDELHSLYGDPDDFYNDGVNTWESFGVKFNLGFGDKLTQLQIQEIKESIQNYYISANNGKKMSENRIKMVNKSLEFCGVYDTKLDSIGYASTICSSAIGNNRSDIDEILRTECNEYSSCENKENYKPTKKNGFSFTSSTDLKPGDILINLEWYAMGLDSVLVYLGEYTDPLTGKYSHWVIQLSGEKPELSGEKPMYRCSNGWEMNSHKIVYRTPGLNR